MNDLCIVSYYMVANMHNAKIQSTEKEKGRTREENQNTKKTEPNQPTNNTTTSDFVLVIQFHVIRKG